MRNLKKKKRNIQRIERERQQHRCRILKNQKRKKNKAAAGGKMKKKMKMYQVSLKMQKASIQKRKMMVPKKMRYRNTTHWYMKQRGMMARSWVLSSPKLSTLLFLP